MMERIHRLVPVLIIIAIVFFGTGCMTSKENLFSEVVSSEISTSSKNIENRYYDKETSGLRIKTYPSRAKVYINDSYSGITPLINYLTTGEYKITVEKEGYYRTTEWVNYVEGESVSLDIELEMITGFLYISSYPEDADITTTWTNLSSGINELQVGRHLVRAEFFGYEPQEQYVIIGENKTTNLTITMEPADFRLSDLFIIRKIFNPANSASLGESRISFNVTTPGTGELEIFSSTGEHILFHNFSLFDDWKQVFVWDGKDGYGKTTPDGTYRVVVSGRDMDGNNLDRKETFITVDSNLIIRVRNILSGSSGTLFCPTPDILPTGSFQLALEGLGHIDGVSEDYRFPVILGTRLAPVKDLEISAQAGVIIQESEAYIFSVSAKKVVLPARNFKPFELSGTLKGTFLYDMYTDSQTNFTGLSGGITGSVSAGPFSLVLSPELTVSPFRVSYPSEKNTGFYIWGYGRSALLLDLGPTMIAVSGAVRTVPFTEDFAIDYPFLTGVELHWLIPGTGIFISGIVSGEFNSASDYYINAGGGIGIIN